ETNPVCDHAQNNIRIPRFLVGILIPADQRRRMKKGAGFVWEFGPVYLTKPVRPAGNYFLYLSARHLVTQAMKEIAKLRPVARFRGQAFADLQSWVSHHASRPGMMLLRER